MTPHEKRVSIFETQEQYLQMKAEWAGKQEHTAWDHAIYNLLRGFHVEKGFTPLQRKSRIDNGHVSAIVEMDWQFRMLLSKDGNEERLATRLTAFGEAVNPLIVKKAYELFEKPVSVDFREAADD